MISIKEKLYNLITYKPDEVFVLSSNDKITSFRELNVNILKCISYLKKNYKKKNIIYIEKNTENFFVFFLACLFANYKIFPVDPKTKKSVILDLKKNSNLII